MKCAVVVFPGSNCDHDVYHVLKHTLGQETVFLWHQDDSLQGAELVVLPGGFSYGDYLRAGALAALSPVMGAVKRHAEAGGLLPGAMRRNRRLRFECRDVFLRVERDDLPFTSKLRRGQVLRMPIAHGEGNYEDTPEALDALERNGQVVLRYTGPDGTLAPQDAERWNPNGSARAIAGVCNRVGNVLGLMPHPERSSEEMLGNTDGLLLFQSALESGSRVLAGAQEGRR